MKIRNDESKYSCISPVLEEILEGKYSLCLSSERIYKPSFKCLLSCTQWFYLSVVCVTVVTVTDGEHCQEDPTPECNGRVHFFHCICF